MHPRRKPQDESEKTGRRETRAATDEDEGAIEPPARPRLDVDTATRAYIGGLGPHDADEDLHPHRLDEVESDLEDALGRDALARRAAIRDARDAI